MFKFLPVKQFADDLFSELDQNPTQIEIDMFQLKYSDFAVRLADKLIYLAQNNTEIILNLDYIYSRIGLGENIILLLDSKAAKIKRKEAVTKTKELLDKLRSNNIKVKFTNKVNPLFSTLIPFWHRDHRKNIILHFENKKIAYFGSVNINNNYDSGDYMLKTLDNTAIAFLEQTNFLKKDLHLSLNTNHKLLYDAGKFNKSIIMQNALDIIKNAREKIIFVSQISPEPKLIKLFDKKAQSGVSVKIYDYQGDQSKFKHFPFNIIYKSSLKAAKSKLIQWISTKKYTHAKILICDNYLLLGSHNITFSTQLLSTKEVSVLIQDNNFVKEVKKFIGGL